MQGAIEEMWRRDEGREEKGDDKMKRRERKNQAMPRLLKANTN